MSDDEDDYLSDNFLASLEATKSSSSKTYSEIRKESKLRSERLQQTNRVKSRRERELEAREEALSKTLFERAEEDAQKAGDGRGNKALAMMMKMGFKPGQALGQEDGAGKGLVKAPDEEDLAPSDIATPTPDPVPPSPKRRGNLKEPLPLNEWMGKKGIGLGGKRALSPSAIESMAKAAKLSESADIDTFRNRTREEYLERQAEGRLRAAQKTCETQDAEAGITFNVFWINPEVPETIPPQLLQALGEDAYVLAPMAVRQRALNDVQARLHLNMRSDALEPELPMDVVEETRPQEEVTIPIEDFDEETIAKATAFLRLSFTERLAMILAYLRDRYHYCFWCGTQYKSGDELETSCPGTNEEDHD